jgi:hypothetical protein
MNKSSLLRWDQERQNDYNEVKGFLLNKFQLTAFQFKSRFDQVKRTGDETWTLFVPVLNAYLSFTVVAETFDAILNGCSRRFWLIAFTVARRHHQRIYPDTALAISCFQAPGSHLGSAAAKSELHFDS